MSNVYSKVAFGVNSSASISIGTPPLSVVDDLNIDSLVMQIPCNSTITLSADGGVGATYEWYDSTATIISTNSSITVGSGQYVVSADISGCSKFSFWLLFFLKLK